MNEILKIFIYFILIMSVLNLLRMTIYLIGGDIYALKRTIRDKNSKKRSAYRPYVSLIVPAHNEEAVIYNTLECLLKIKYPKSRLQIIIVNDGSTDNTSKIVQKFIKAHKDTVNMQLYGQRNSGKANALNNAIKKRATGSLIMCLDADSLIAQDGVKKAVEYFRDKKVVALASNVNIIDNNTILGIAQRFEYLISYHMKKAQTVYNIEYIIGGIGSMFRKKTLEQVQYYDTNTMTEDIDLTMKIVATGNIENRVAYAADCITYTEAVPSLSSLIQQRYRWKYGRLQTFVKHYRIFFSTKNIYSKQLTWLFLPFSLLMEILFILEPIIVTYIIGSAMYYNRPKSLLMAVTVISMYIWINIWSTYHLSLKEKAKLTFLAPSMYAVLYLLSLAEYMALLKTIITLPNIKKSISGKKITWVSPERSGSAQGVIL